MTDFTPQPWTNDNGLVNGRRADDTTPSFDIYDAVHWAGDDKEAQANAHLIAAAPDMYAALMALKIKNDRVMEALSKADGK